MKSTLKTSKPFSTISYNSEPFLIERLKDLENRRIINFWAFIDHIPEQDEKKAHKHLYVVPNGQLCTDKFIDYLLEPDLTLGKPLKCLPCQSSKFGDWYLYALHDTAYLLSKMQSREYHYTDEDLHVSDEDTFTEFKHQIDFSKLGNKKTVDVYNRLLSGDTLADLIKIGMIPVQQLNNYKWLECTARDALFRSSRSTHTPLTAAEELKAVQSMPQDKQELLIKAKALEQGRINPDTGEML